ncbi:hypothetical protein AB1Y20_004438 [Prymnesium parvum]|uniref:Uridine kinase n=1 Tax=Prymnesium parvum TaxID=97485 RepID=A0AB34IZ52_PRYPA
MMGVNKSLGLVDGRKIIYSRVISWSRGGLIAPRAMVAVWACGPSAAGKSSLVRELFLRQPDLLTIAMVDDCYLPPAPLPWHLPLHALAWPDGALSPALARRGADDTNHPAALHWPRLLADASARHPPPPPPPPPFLGGRGGSEGQVGVGVHGGTRS